MESYNLIDYIIIDEDYDYNDPDDISYGIDSHIRISNVS